MAALAASAEGRGVKKFSSGLVVGKFCPLHLGHERVMNAAMEACRHVVVLSYTKPEFPGCGPSARDRWLEKRAPATTRWVLDDQRLASMCLQRGLPIQRLPDNEAPDATHRSFVAWLLREVLRIRVDAVFTSEAYGEGFAAALTAAQGDTFAAHVCVDPGRTAIPISGSRLREDPHGLRRFLSPDVYADFVEKICILGGESTGKTTLAADLAEALGSAWVPEYGRELWIEQGGRLMFEDMERIALVQVQREDTAALTANRFLVCDTSPLTTLLYSDEMFARASPALSALAGRSYRHTFVCADDFEFVQDGTRKDETFRSRQQARYLKELRQRGTPFIEITGSRENRLGQAMHHLRLSGRGN